MENSPKGARKLETFKSCFEGADPTAEFSLVDAAGRFLVVPTEEETHGGTSGPSEHGEEGAESRKLIPCGGS